MAKKFKIKVRGSTARSSIQNRGFRILSFKKISPKMFEVIVRKKKRRWKKWVF